MAIVYILDNKDSALNKKMWARQATVVLSASDVRVTGLVIGKSCREDLMNWMKTLKPQDVVITDGNKQGDDFIDSDFLACLQAVNPSFTHFALVSADVERIANFKRQIEEISLNNVALYVCLSNQLRGCLESDVLPALLAQETKPAEANPKKRCQKEAFPLRDEDGNFPEKKLHTDLPKNAVSAGMANLLWQSLPVPPLPSSDNEQANNNKEEETVAPIKTMTKVS